jgi:hypothetical protein
MRNDTEGSTVFTELAGEDPNYERALRRARCVPDFAPRTCHLQRRTVHIRADSCTTESWLDQVIRRIAAGPGIAP